MVQHFEYPTLIISPLLYSHYTPTPLPVYSTIRSLPTFHPYFAHILFQIYLHSTPLHPQSTCPHSTSSLPPLYLTSISTPSLLHPHSILTPSSLHPHSILTPSSLHLHSILTLSSLHPQSISQAASFFTPRALYYHVEAHINCELESIVKL